MLGIQEMSDDLNKSLTEIIETQLEQFIGEPNTPATYAAI